MANGDVAIVSEEYLASFDKSIGIAGMEKIQSFSFLQRLGYDGQLSYMGTDFHGKQDFCEQLADYSGANPKELAGPWAVVTGMAQQNLSIIAQLAFGAALGLPTGPSFLGIYNFGRVFSLAPSDLISPSSVASKVSVYLDQSTKSTSANYSGGGVAGGSIPTNPSNASQLNGYLIVGTPTLINNVLQFNGTNLVWSPSGSGGSGGSSTLAGDTDVSLSSPSNGQVLTYNFSTGKWINQSPAAASSLLSADTDVLLSALSNGQFLVYNASDGKWENHTLLAGDIPTIAESQVANLVTDLATLASSISSVSTSLSNYQLLSGKDAVSGYAGLTSSGLLKANELPTPTTSTFGGVKDLSAIPHDFVTSIVNGIPIAARPSLADLSDANTVSLIPTGTGWVHITSGVEDPVASTPTKADVGLSNVTNDAQAIPLGVQNESYTYATDTGTVNAYAISIIPAITSYVAGLSVVFKAANTNTGASTLAVSGLTAEAIKKDDGTVALSAGDITSGQIIAVRYDGASFQMMSVAGKVTHTDGALTSGQLLVGDSGADIIVGDLSGDVTTAGSAVTTVAKIQSTSVTGTTGSGKVVFDTAPTLSSPIVGTQSASDNSTKAASTGYVDRIAIRIVGISIDAGSTAIVTGIQATSIQVPFAGTIVGWSATFASGVSDSITVEVDKKASSPPPSAPTSPNTTTDKISASTPISVSAANSSSGGASAVSTWTTTVASWDVIQFNITSAPGSASKVNIRLYIQQ